MAKLATLVVVHDAVKDPALLENFLRSLPLLNPGYVDVVDVVVVNQPSTQESLDQLGRLRAATGVPFEIHQCHHPVAGGYPVWDIMDELGKFVPDLATKYVAFLHPEEFFSEGYFRALAGLASPATSPPLILGNLCRTGTIDQCRAMFRAKRSKATCEKGTLRNDAAWDTSRKHSDALRGFIRKGQLPALRKHLASLSLTRWDIFKPATAHWQEDVFFADVHFLRDTAFFRHADRLYFQDVYDFMGAFYRTCQQAGYRLRLAKMAKLGRIYHLWHDYVYYQFSPAVISWFDTHPAEQAWRRYSRAEMVAMAKTLTDPTKSADVSSFRNAAGGSLDRFTEAVVRWVREHDQEICRWADPMTT